jgi:lipoprotein NlpD
LRVSRSICSVGLCCLLLGACADTAGEGPESYVVRPQDTLYSIAWRHDLDYRDLARWNDIGADFHISVGQVLVLGPGRPPSPESRVPRAAATPGPATGARSGPTPAMPVPGRAGSGAQDAPQVGKPRPLPGSPASALSNAGPGASSAPSPRAASPALGTLNGPDTPAGSGANGALKWVWPTDRVGAPRPVPGGGILLSGRLGQDVRAASAGRVVYTGSGLRGYGNLIIIKHADSLLSAYAHNREMLVHDGQEVAVGQVIAQMGEGARQSPILYFEIRQNGRPVDPLPFLSRAK